MLKYFLLNACLFCVSIAFSGGQTWNRNKTAEPALTYEVARARRAVKIDADWNKPAWKKTKSIVIEKYMGAIPKFKPGVEADFAG